MIRLTPDHLIDASPAPCIPRDPRHECDTCVRCRSFHSPAQSLGRGVVRIDPTSIMRTDAPCGMRIPTTLKPRLQ